MQTTAAAAVTAAVRTTAVADINVKANNCGAVNTVPQLFFKGQKRSKIKKISVFA